MALVVFTGGARSGKSRAAQQMARSRQADGSTVVVAVFARSDLVDAEMAERIERHQQDRPSGFETIEAADSRSWLERVPDESLLVVDCFGTLLGLAMEEVWNEFAEASLDEAGQDLDPRVAVAVQERADSLVASIASRPGDTIVVTNEVGMSVVPEYASARLFRDVLGRVNSALVRDADSSYLAVSGRLVNLSGLPASASWPVD